MALDHLRGRRVGVSPVLQLPALLVALCAALVLGGCGFGESSGSGPSNEFTGIVRNPPLKVGDDSLPQVNPDRSLGGDHFRAGKDGLMLTYFGYTFCPDVCPTTLADLRIALTKLTPAEKEEIDVGMVTIDPKRDTPKVLNEYLGHFFPRPMYGAFRTTDEKRLGRVETSFNASHELEKLDKDGNYSASHTAQVYAVDDRGVVQLEWAFGSRPDDIATDIKKLLAGQDESPSS